MIDFPTGSTGGYVSIFRPINPSTASILTPDPRINSAHNYRFLPNCNLCCFRKSNSTSGRTMTASHTSIHFHRSRRTLTKAIRCSTIEVVGIGAKSILLPYWPTGTRERQFREFLLAFSIYRESSGADQVLKKVFFNTFPLWNSNRIINRRQVV